MPWVSKRQQRWGHTPAGIRALGGADKVHEWDAATKASGYGGAHMKGKAFAHAAARALLGRREAGKRRGMSKSRAVTARTPRGRINAARAGRMRAC